MHCRAKRNRQFTTNHRQYNTRLNRRFLTDFLCNDNFTVKIDVSVQLNAEGTEPIFSGMPVIVDIDVDPPEAPMIAPNLGSGEQALIVSLAGESVPDDVARHEICYAPRGSINAPDDCDINDSLTAEERTLRLYCGFTAADCRETTSLYLVTVNIGSRVYSMMWNTKSWWQPSMP